MANLANYLGEFQSNIKPTMMYALSWEQKSRSAGSVTFTFRCRPRFKYSTDGKGGYNWIGWPVIFKATIGSNYNRVWMRGSNGDPDYQAKWSSGTYGTDYIGDWDVDVSYTPPSNGSDVVTVNLDVYVEGYGTGADWNKDFSPITYSSYTPPNSSPNAPSQWWTQPGLYESNVKVSFSSGSDAENNIIGYDVEYAEYHTYANSSYAAGTWTPWIRWQSNYNGADVNFNITGMTRGNRLQFRVRSVDAYNAVSGWLESSTGIQRNERPSTPTNLQPSGAGAYEGTITISWTASTDKDTGQTIYYGAEVSKNNGTWTNIFIDVTSTSYSYSIPAGDAPGTSYQFRVVAYDSNCLDGDHAWSDWAYTAIVQKDPNGPPPVPTIIGPLNNSTVYDLRPRVAILLGTDPQGDLQSLSVCWDGSWYSSVDYPGYFSRGGASYGANARVIFRPSTQSLGTHTIRVKASDGAKESAASSTITFTIADLPVVPMDQSDIGNTDIGAVMAAGNNAIAAYGGSTIPVSDIFPDGRESDINTTLITMINNLNDLKDMLNLWDSTTPAFDTDMIPVTKKDNIGFPPLINIRSGLFTL